MKIAHSAGLAVLLLPVCIGAMWPGGTGANGVTVSYKADVAPVLKKYCLPCHAEENYNPSELALDSYALLMKGGKHGDAVEPGEPDESIMIQKLTQNPPFGERMPLHSKRKKTTTPPKYLSEEEVRILAEWISQGAPDN
jgi:hypothetical protein